MASTKTKMNREILLITVFAVLGILIMGGCIGDKGKEQVTPAPETLPEVKELTSGEVVEKAKAAVYGVKTYALDSMHVVTTSGKPDEEKILCEIDRENERKYCISSYVEAAAGEEIPIETETYVIGDVAYTNAAMVHWFKSETDWAGEDVLRGINDLLSNATLKGIEKVGGKDAYVLELAAGKSVFNEKFLALGGEDVEEMINNSGNINVKLWVAKDTFLPLKEQRTADTTLKGDSVKIEIDNFFKDYGSRRNIQLPEAAKSAEDVNSDGTIENPEQVKKTIDAIDGVTSYLLAMKKSVAGPSGSEETHDVSCDRKNRKLVNINNFTVSGDFDSEKVSLVIYTIDNMNYYQYSGAWLKSDTQWESEDFISVIKNLLETTKVEVTEENESWIFDIKTNKDAFGADLTEIANELENAEPASIELNSNAKNVVVKVWVSKNTFLPLKEFRSIESTLGGKKITIIKELGFTDYNKPVTVKLPSGAETAEHIDSL